jgi:transposase
MRAYIRELQELCIHLLSLTYSYRHIAKIFGISAKWVSKIVRERSIENLPSVYITLDRDVKKGEQIDILQYAIALYKKKSVIDESIE